MSPRVTFGATVARTDKEAGENRPDFKTYELRKRLTP
jgi:hypothetical protein